MAAIRQRRCCRCGNPLSRYNDGDECAACIAARRDLPAQSVPTELWRTDDMRQALARWDWKTVFGLVSSATGMSQTRLGSMIGLSQPQVSRIMNGTSSAFDIRVINNIVDGLGAPRNLAGLAPTTPDDGDTVALDPTKELSPVDRRTFLAASVALPLNGILDRQSEVNTVTYEDARQIRGLLPKLYELDDHDGGAQASTATRWCLHQVDELLGSAHYGESAAVELQLAHGELAEMAGWLDFDAGRIAAAQWYFGEALRSAQLAEDLNLEVLVLSSMIMVARHRERPREAIRLAQLAQRRAAGWASPRLLSLLAVREATGWAQAGDGPAAERALQRALNLFEPHLSQTDPGWIAFHTEAEMHASKATISMYLDKPNDAINNWRNALGRLEPQYQRNRALYTARLALAHLREGDDQEAVTLLTTSMSHIGTTKSGRVRAELGLAFAEIAMQPVQDRTKKLLSQAAELELLPSA